jgi:hypothetical protein
LFLDSHHQGEEKLMKKVLLSAVATMFLASPALAAFSLQVTEIWMGNEPGENLTDDWIEISNLGDMPWTAATDGNIYFEDSSADATTADLLAGIPSIAPGESVVFVDGSATVGGLNLFVWHDLWDSALAGVGKPVPQVGTYEGAGLGQGGDTVNIFLDASLDGVDAADLYTNASYPDANSNGGQSFDSFFDVFTTIDFPAAVTTPNDAGQPGIGTPGYIAPIPEPTSIGLMGLATILLAAKRR